MQMGGNECRELFTAISATLKKEPALYLQQKPTFFTATEQEPARIQRQELTERSKKDVCFMLEYTTAEIHNLPLPNSKTK